MTGSIIVGIGDTDDCEHALAGATDLARSGDLKLVVGGRPHRAVVSA